ncbi:hypothetical protein BDV25DRAFT_164783 [Aspergillus avenaceus]|uniref:MutL C-terminal dimerisation domain-containing protein n=1 Tax=Aspergillus avenaceus TaxID=36643 RepID=A0A5N6TH03_ASPAV|nr:hypothetical protein BDV25DRAFT_164783 [Aspergillus avenaceus]
MPLNTHRIEPLPSDVVSKLKSSTSITHLNGVIVELVKNALDANAHTIYVTVDYRRGGCKVDDDGDGILPTEFEPTGGLGKAHHTSKRQSIDMYGRKGLFLASLSSLSLLTVTSRHIHHQNANTITFHHSAPVARLIPTPMQQELRFSCHGTRVTVNDLFGSMPVRVKSRALSLERSDELDRQYNELKQLMVSLMIANDALLKLVIVDLNKAKKLAICPRTRGHQNDGLDIQRIVSILAQAEVIETPNVDHWDTVSAKVPYISISAAISLVPSPTKKAQFVSVGLNPIFPRYSSGLLYSEINRMFSLSDFGSTGKSAINVEDSSGDWSDLRGSINNTVNRWAMFYIRIDTCEPLEVDEEHHGLPESNNSVQRIIDVLTAMLDEFLRQYNLRPRVKRRKMATSRKQVSSESSRKSIDAPVRVNGMCGTEEALCDQLKLPSFRKEFPDIGQCSGAWSKIRSAQDSSNVQSSGRVTKPNTESSQYTGHPSGQGVSPHLPGTAIYPSYKGPVHLLARSEPMQLHDRALAEGGTVLSWVEPFTGQSHLVNPRTGQSVEARAFESNRRAQSASPLRTTITSGSTGRPKSAILNRTQNAWVENLLERWENSIFSRTEKPINRVDENYVTEGEEGIHDASTDLCVFGKPRLSRFRGKLRKGNFERAEIIAQVDRKFILVKTKSPEPDDSSTSQGSIIVLIDQHAADERCRVETLLHEFCTQSTGGLKKVQTTTLDPIVFDIPSPEAPIFELYTEFFRDWGIEYTVGQGSASSFAHVVVHTLPTLIAERCRLEPYLIRNIIRGELWNREEGEKGPSSNQAILLEDSIPENGTSLDMLNNCPQGIIDLLNSRACRTSVMFNDVLTIDECQHLVKRLARCVFPFQCAHGRPSMIPILDMMDSLDWDQREVEYMTENRGQLGFLDAFKTWKR